MFGEVINLLKGIMKKEKGVEAENEDKKKGCQRGK